MDDVRYSELLFLRELAKGPAHVFDPNGTRAKALGLCPTLYPEMVAVLVEDLFARFHRDDVQLIVAKLRGELSHGAKTGYFQDHDWVDPRRTLEAVLGGIHRHGLQ